MRFIHILLVGLLAMGPAVTESFANSAGEGRAVAAEKSKKAKGKKGKAGKTAKGKNAKKKKGKAGAKGKKAANKRAKGKAKKSAKKMGTHAPLDAPQPGDAMDPADPTSNFEVSPDMQDELPVPNNGNLTD